MDYRLVPRVCTGLRSFEELAFFPCDFLGSGLPSKAAYRIQNLPITKKEVEMTRHLRLAGFLAFAMLLIPLCTLGQTIVTGGLSGTITDGAGGNVEGANLNLKNAAKGETYTATSSGGGVYHFAFLKPGNYTLTVSKEGFKSVTESVMIQLGQVASANVALEVGSTTTTVEVTSEGALLQTENANITSDFNTNKIQETPNHAGDITSIPQDAPGVSMNNSTGGRVWQFSTLCLPAPPNLFTINGN